MFNSDHKEKKNSRKVSELNSEIFSQVESHVPLVSSSVIAKRYNVSARYILKLASEGEIPCTRIGKKCVRFNPELVAQAIEGQNN